MKKTRRKVPVEIYLTTMEDSYNPWSSGHRLCTKESVIQQVRAVEIENDHRLRYPNHFKGQLRTLHVHRAIVFDWDNVTSEFIKEDSDATI